MEQKTHMFVSSSAKPRRNLLCFHLPIIRIYIHIKSRSTGKVVAILPYQVSAVVQSMDLLRAQGICLDITAGLSKIQVRSCAI